MAAVSLHPALQTEVKISDSPELTDCFSVFDYGGVREGKIVCFFWMSQSGCMDLNVYLIAVKFNLVLFLCPVTVSIHHRACLVSGDFHVNQAALMAAERVR